MTGLQELYTDRGLLSGAASGLKEGADLGHMFAQTGEINQRVLRDKQMLPMDLAKIGAEIDQQTMANDLTRSVQTPEYLGLHGANATSQEKVTKEQLAHAMKILPFEQYIDFQNKSSQAQVQLLQGISTALRSGQIDQVYSQLLPMATDQKQKAQLDAIFKEAKASPQGMQKALSQLDQSIFQMTNTMNQANLPQQQQRYLELLKFIADKHRADASVRASSNTTEKPTFQSEIIKLRRLKEQLSGSPKKEDINRVKQIEGMINDYINASKGGGTTTESFAGIESETRKDFSLPGSLGKQEPRPDPLGYRK